MELKLNHVSKMGPKQSVGLPCQTGKSLVEDRFTTKNAGIVEELLQYYIMSLYANNYMEIITKMTIDNDHEN